MSFPAWNGGKDKGAFRTLSDVAGGTDGIRTVTQTQGDTTTTLRTRAGNPEMTIRKKGGPIALVEAGYKLRKYFRDITIIAPSTDIEPGTGIRVTIGSKPSLPVLSRATFYLRSLVLIAIGKVTFPKPPETTDVLKGDWKDAANLTWQDAGFNHEDFHAPVLIDSTDGIYTLINHSPKRAKTPIGTLRFKRIDKVAPNTPLENLSDHADGTALRFFSKPIVKRVRYGGLGGIGAALTFVVAPIKKLIVSGAGKEVTFSTPVADKSGDKEYSQDLLQANYGEPHGALAHKLNPFDHVIAFGQPYDGVTDIVLKKFVPSNGDAPLLLSPDNDSAAMRWLAMGPAWLNDGVHSGAPIRDDTGFVQLVQFADMPSAPSLSSYDLPEEKAVFKNYAILCGSRRQYGPVFRGGSGPRNVSVPDPSLYFLNGEPRGSNCFGHNTWLYRTGNGIVWCFWVRYVWVEYDGSSSKVEVWGRRVMDFEGDFELVFTESPPLAPGTIGYQSGWDSWYDIYGSLVHSTADGRVAAVALVAPTVEPAESYQFAKTLNVTDAGDFDVPVITATAHVFNRERSGQDDPTQSFNPWFGYSAKTESSKSLIAWCLLPSGTIKKAYSHYSVVVGTASYHGGDGVTVTSIVSVNGFTKIYNGASIVASDTFSWTGSVQHAGFDRFGAETFHAPGSGSNRTSIIGTHIQMAKVPSIFQLQKSTGPMYGQALTAESTLHSLLHDDIVTISTGTFDVVARNWSVTPVTEWQGFVTDHPVTNQFLFDKWPW